MTAVPSVAVVGDAPVARTAFASVEAAQAFLQDLVAIYDAGMREPIPLPLKTGEAWARSAGNPRNARFRAEKPWSKDRFGVENEDEAHVRVWGRDAPLSVLLQQQPRPGEDYPGQTTRLGSLASRLWVPILERSR